MRRIDKLRELIAIGTLYHRMLGPVHYTEACLQRDATNPDLSTMFVEHEGELIEVKLTLVRLGPPVL